MRRYAAAAGARAEGDCGSTITPPKPPTAPRSSARSIQRPRRRARHRMVVTTGKQTTRSKRERHAQARGSPITKRSPSRPVGRSHWSCRSRRSGTSSRATPARGGHHPLDARTSARQNPCHQPGDAPRRSRLRDSQRDGVRLTDIVMRRRTQPPGIPVTRPCASARDSRPWAGLGHPENGGRSRGVEQVLCVSGVRQGGPRHESAEERSISKRSNEASDSSLPLCSSLPLTQK